MTVGAHEIVAGAIEAERHRHVHRSSPRLAGAALEALRDAGYAIVKLPTNFQPFRVDEDGDVWDEGTHECYTPLEADIFAGRLLAAAKAAEGLCAGAVWGDE